MEAGVEWFGVAGSTNTIADCFSGSVVVGAAVRVGVKSKLSLGIVALELFALEIVGFVVVVALTEVVALVVVVEGELLAFLFVWELPSLAGLLFADTVLIFTWCACLVRVVVDDTKLREREGGRASETEGGLNSVSRALILTLSLSTSAAEVLYQHDQWYKVTFCLISTESSDFFYYFFVGE